MAILTPLVVLLIPPTWKTSLITYCCAAGLVGLLTLPPTKAAAVGFTFTRVVDSSTPIPGGTGNFVFFTDPFTTTAIDSRPAASIENGVVVFSGSGQSGQTGIYAAAVGGPITTIADTNTSLPDGTGNFRLFGTPSLSQGNLAFPGSDVIGPVAQGAFFAPLGGSIKTIADRNTPVPGGVGVFRGIGSVALDDVHVAFGHSSVGKDRILVADGNGQISSVADSADFGSFSGALSFRDGIVAFIPQQTFIFAAPVGSPPMLVVDVTATFGHPGGGIISTGFNPSLDNGTIAFFVGSNGIYIATLQGLLTANALFDTPIPNGTGNFTAFDADSPSQRDGIVAFRGFGSSGQEGIYASIGGSLIKVIDLNDSLNGKTLTHLFLGYEAVSGNQIAFAAQFTDGSRGIYVAQIVTVLSVALDVSPGSPNNNINPKSNGVISVAILSTKSFDTSTVDQASLRFGPNQLPPEAKGHLRDVNRDGLLDLVHQFRVQDSGIQCGDISVLITGQTVDGVPIQGSDSITTVGCNTAKGKKK